ncbi:MAG: UDP-N-acetylmuramoyl-tripeptide--D-alanyl-D-alanine ligase [Ktedonobacterales bacterium]
MFTRDELIAAAGTRPQGGLLPLRFAGGAIDSRGVHHDELFVALKGEHADGHAYIPQAIKAGAAAILCARPNDEATARGVPQIIVSDPLDVLQRLARNHLRRQPRTRVIAVTGSNGKTSVKEATAALLQQLAPTLKTEGNLNTETGLPLTLLRLSPEHTFAVLEMGAQWVGEISALCRIAPPDIAVCTVVGPEHLEFFGSLENVAKGESEAIAALDSSGVAVLNDDDRAVREMARCTKARVLTYGHRAVAMVRAQRMYGDTLSGMRFTISYGGQRERVVLNIPGAHAITTALAAASIALACGMDLPAAAAALSEIRPVKRRGEIKQAANGARLVDDSYNANRQSAIAAVEMLKGAKIEKGGRRWFVFGDMLELGTHSAAEHAAVGKVAAGSVDELVLVGADVAATADAALQAGMPAERVHLFRAPLSQPAELAAARLEAASLVRRALHRDDVVLVKGSLGVGMDVVVAELQEHRGAKHAQDDIEQRLGPLTQRTATDQLTPRP